MFIKSLAFLASKHLSPYDMYYVVKKLNLSPTVINDMYSANSDFKVITENINDVKFKFLMEINNDINEKKCFYDNEKDEIDEFILKNNEACVLGETRLHIAIGLNLKSVVKALIEKGADLNIKGNHESTPGRFYIKISPLQLALEYAKKSLLGLSFHKFATIMNLDTDCYQKQSQSLLFDYTNISTLLIEKGADINIKNMWGKTPLHQAIVLNKKKIAIKLIVKGTDLNILDEDGKTPLHHATENNIKTISKMLISKGADLNIKDKMGKTPLHHATENKSEYISKLLISKEADLNSKDGMEKTPLHYAIRHMIIVAKLLIEREAFNIQDGIILIYALRSRNEKICRKISRLLIQKGVEVNVKDREDKLGKTPLHLAISYELEDISRLLIDKGADINVQCNFFGYTPLHEAIKYKFESIARLLIDKGVDLNVQSSLYGNTPLHIAIEEKMNNLAKLLISKGVDINIKNNTGKTPLYFAVENKMENIVRILIDKGADINVQDILFGYTPLHIAIEEKKNKIAKLLISKGADINIKNDTGKTPLDLMLLFS